MTVSFQNRGELDLVALKTFGVSAKETENPVGYFGTGLKYALAIILRNGGSFKLYRGTVPHVFTVRDVTVRSESFQLLQVDGEDLGFTTAVGKDWEPWMAYRELYCNTMDEPEGQVSAGSLEPAEGYTTIVVEGLDECYEQQDKIILNSTAFHVTGGIEVHNHFNTSVFFRRIRVMQTEYPSLFTYNFVGRRIALTEDRTAKEPYVLMHVLGQAVLQSDNESFIRQVVTAPEDTLEQRLDVDWSTVPSEAFMNVMRNTPMKKITNMSALNKFNKMLEVNKTPRTIELNSIEKKQLARAIDFVEQALGYPVGSDEVFFSDDLPQDALACVYEGQIFLSRKVFQLGTKVVAHALYEEHLHKHHGYSDHTRQFQNYLFEKILSMGEELWGEPV